MHSILLLEFTKRTSVVLRIAAKTFITTPSRSNSLKLNYRVYSFMAPSFHKRPKKGPDLQIGFHLAWDLGETKVERGVSKRKILWEDQRYPEPEWCDESTLRWVNETCQRRRNNIDNNNPKAPKRPRHVTVRYSPGVLQQSPAVIKPNDDRFKPDPPSEVSSSSSQGDDASFQSLELPTELTDNGSDDVEEVEEVMPSKQTRGNKARTEIMEDDKKNEAVKSNSLEVPSPSNEKQLMAQQINDKLQRSPSTRDNTLSGSSFHSVTTTYPSKESPFVMSVPRKVARKSILRPEIFQQEGGSLIKKSTIRTARKSVIRTNYAETSSSDSDTFLVRKGLPATNPTDSEIEEVFVARKGQTPEESSDDSRVPQKNFWGQKRPAKPPKSSVRSSRDDDGKPCARKILSTTKPLTPVVTIDSSIEEWNVQEDTKQEVGFTRRFDTRDIQNIRALCAYEDEEVDGNYVSR